MDDECSARAVCKKSMMKARNVPKGLVLATPNAGADKQTSSKQPRIAKNGRCERSGARGI
jgi:hypothetical protein